MQQLACQTCEARVAVAKYSPVHTSIQWNADATRACREMTTAAETPDGNYVLRCSGLDRSIDVAVDAGEIAISTRSEPRIRALHRAPESATAG